MWDAIAFGALIKAKRGQRGLTQPQLAERILGSVARKGEISQVENGKVTPQEDTIQKYLDFFEISEAEMAPIRMARPAAEQLGDIPALSREALQNLAARFGLDDPYDSPDGELRRLLTMKADEYRSLKSEVDQIDEGLKRLSNLKAAAQDAIARVDLDEVEELLGRVQEVELEEAAKTAELRAQNALLRGNVDQAYRLLSAAAESFAAVDEVEPARKLSEFGRYFFDHGNRYGGISLNFQEDMLRRASEIAASKDPLLWAKTMQNLGLALGTRGTRTAGEAGAKLLGEAVEAYRAALRVRTEAAHPMDWARTMQNLGNALADQGTLTASEAGAVLLSEAVEAHRAALRVRTEAAHPVDWARTMQNLGGALYEQGRSTQGEAGAKLLAEAVEAYRAALRVTTQDAHPVDWAMIMQNLANVLGDLGERTNDASGLVSLGEAIDTYKNSLVVRTEVEQPMQWAITQANIAMTEQQRAKHESNTDPRPNLEASLAHADAALRVFDPEHTAFYHEATVKVRDRIQAALDALDEA